jgi:hypothetical protein
MAKRAAPPSPDAAGPHGGLQLPGLRIDSYNLAVRTPDGEGFLGDRASNRAFLDVLDQARRRQRTGKDVFGRTPSKKLEKKDIDLVMMGGDADAAHLVHLAVEEHAQRLAHVVRCFLLQPQWDGVQRIVLGGGFADSRFGGLASRRAGRLLKLARSGVAFTTLHNDPDQAALLGWVQLLPTPLHRHRGFLAVDVGGTKLRCGIVLHRLDRARDGTAACVFEHLQWRHADDDPDRGDAVARLAAMLNGLGAQARTLGLDLAPFVGIACPGQIEADGGITRGAQNLPGDWETPFNLPRALGQRLDAIGGRAPTVMMHNDAVVQGLSELPRMRGVRRWGVMTIGTGLGNASFTNG